MFAVFDQFGQINYREQSYDKLASGYSTSMTVKMPSYSLITEFSLPLMAGIILALVLRNTTPDFYETIASTHIITIGAIEFSFKHIINDVFMAFLFGIASKELVDAVKPGGCLRNKKYSINPILATIGGIAVPAAIYAVLTRVIMPGALDVQGVIMPIATDITFAWLGARVLFGSKHPAVQYLLLLAIVDDVIGMMILAIFYPNPELPIQLSWLWLSGLGMLSALLFRINNLQQWFPYILVGGTLSWIGMLNAGLHPALALTLIVPFIPSPKCDAGLYQHMPNSHSPMQDFEHNMKPVIDFGLFFFGIVNAGILINGGSFTPLTAIIFISAIAGKFIGIFTVAYLAKRSGMPLPEGVGLKDISKIAMLAGVNITVSLFLADSIFGGTQYENPVKMGALLSLLVPLGLMGYEGYKRVSKTLAEAPDENKHFVG